MWASLRSDIREFVSSVAEDGSKVLHTIDSKIIESDNTKKGFESAEQKGHTNSDGHMVISAEGEIASWGVDYNATGLIADAFDEAERRMSLMETYTEDLISDTSDGPIISDSNTQDENNEDADSLNEEKEVEEVYDFLSRFDVASKTDEISSILERYPIVQQHFEQLVPVVISYEQFWQRYFFRCNPERIQRQWDEEDERVHQERKQLIERGVTNVKNLFGGALKALHSVTRSGDSSLNHAANKDAHRTANIYEKYQAEVVQQQKALKDNAANKNFGLFEKSRPPFVLNSTDSGDDDVAEYHRPHPHRDEEEIGWGSDEEEEEEEDEFQNQDNVEVEENSSPIDAESKSSTVNKSTTPEVSSPQFIALNNQIHILQSQLVEKDHSIAALKSSLEVRRRERSTDEYYQVLYESQSRELEAVKQSLQAQSEEMEEMKYMLQEEKSTQASLTRDLEEASLLISQLKSDLQRSIDAVHSETQTVTILKEEIDIVVKENALLKSHIDELKSNKVEADQQLAGLIAANKEANDRILQLQADLDSKRCEVERIGRETSANPEVKPNSVCVLNSSPDSNGSSSSMTSSVVQVSSSKIQEGSVADEDDWGDSWGDGDD